jgi:Flp pilus assembly protein TadD
MREQITKLLIAAFLAAGLAGCESFEAVDGEEDLTASITDSSSFGSAPELVWIEKAKENYKNGDYGLAERYYRRAIEERHNNAEAWLGLAASYDRLKRFDLAERAYDQLIQIAGHTPTVLNNLAYHHMLRGDFGTARQTLMKATEKAPNNPYVKRNLQLLDSWEEKAGASAT